MESIKTVNLKKKFDKITAVDDVSLNIQAGETYGIVGPDGAGKTTLIRLLTSILTPTEGTATINGLDTIRESEQVKENIGYMSQRFGLYNDLTVLENILFYADLFNIRGAQRTEKLEQLLHFSNLAPFQHRLAQNLSGGMKQKLGLACALIHTPSILFLDEPTNGVDPVSRRDFWKILNSLHELKTTIFVSTSYLDEAERCQRVSMMHRGKIIATGTPDEIKKLQELSILEIILDDPRAIIEDLNSTFGEQGVRLFGGRIHISLRNSEEGKQQIEAIMKHHNVFHYQILPAIPTLEDVFISILSDKETKWSNPILNML